VHSKQTDWDNLLHQPNSLMAHISWKQRTQEADTSLIGHKSPSMAPWYQPWKFLPKPKKKLPEPNSKKNYLGNQTYKRMAEPIVPIRSSTQLFTEIETIDRGIVMFTDGSCVMVVSATAVNFGLLSEKEQDAIIYSYAGLLNSLSFPIEILIRTQHKDVTAYLQILEDQEKKQKKSQTHSCHTRIPALCRRNRQRKGCSG